MQAVAQIAFIFCGLLAIFAAVTMLLAFVEINSFDKALSRLPNDLPTNSSFNQKSKLGRHAADYVSLLMLASSRNALGSFRVDQLAGPTQAYLRTISIVPRSIVGVLIMGGLLVTLFNLQSSVATLGASFTQLAQEQSATTPRSAETDVKQIQLSMGGIAQAARSAFLRSGEVILVAAFILMLTLLLQRRSQTSARNFIAWANFSYMEALSKKPMDQHAQLEKFGELIEKMTIMVTSFESIGNSMATVGDFGAKLDSSSQLVAQAVSQLPESINASVVQLSAEVTKDISVHLQHQIEHIKRILSIYGDQEVRVRKIQEYLDGFAKQSQVSFDAISHLKLLPEKVEELSRVLSSSNRLNENFAHSSSVLETKIESLNLSEINRIREDIKSIRRELPEGIVRSLEPTFAGLTERLTGMDRSGVHLELQNLTKSVESISTAVNIAELPGVLSRLEILVNELEHRRSGSFVGRLFGN